jgi:hypothetical protein
MGKHEIRLRRKSMSSRRIERHKNYAQLMDKHHKSKRLKRIVQWLIYVFIFLMGLFGLYYTLSHKSVPQSDTESHQTPAYVKTTT